MAANQLGLAAQVPAQMISTDGAPAKVLLGERQIVFRRNTGAASPWQAGPADSWPKPCVI